MDCVRDTFIDAQYVARHHLPHQRFNRYWLNAGYSDVQATVRSNSLPIDIEETRVLKNPEWMLEAKAKVEMGSTLSIILRDDRNTHWAGIYVVMWISGDIVYSEALDRNHPRLNGYVWSDDRAFVFTGDKPFVFKRKGGMTLVRVGVYSIKGGDNGIEMCPVERKYPSTRTQPPAQASTTPKRQKTKKRKDSGFGPGIEDEHEEDHGETHDSEEDSEVDAEVEEYLRQLESEEGSEGEE